MSSFRSVVYRESSFYPCDIRINTAFLVVSALARELIDTKDLPRGDADALVNMYRSDELHGWIIEIAHGGEFHRRLAGLQLREALRAIQNLQATIPRYEGAEFRTPEVGAFISTLRGAALEISPDDKICLFFAGDDEDEEN